MNTGNTVKRLLRLTAAKLPCIRDAAENMQFFQDEKIQGIGTDGLDIFFSRQQIAEADCRHMIMHCLFSHMAIRIDNRQIKDLACDMAAEVLRAELFCEADAAKARRNVTDALPEGCDPHSAEAVARELMELREDELEELEAEFLRDDHRFWYERPKSADRGKRITGFSGFRLRKKELSEEEAWQAYLSEQVPKEWAPAAEGIEGTSGSAHFGFSAGSREERILLRKIGRYDFSRYLRRFSLQQEELMLDPGSFDYIPYYYGLQRYGSLPLIEPLEYTESSKIEELVIAIDTSGSCHRDTVERFLAEIEKILMNKDTFFKKMNIHLFQCDSIIEEHTVIRSRNEWKTCCENLVIRGRGGTDFRPVFARVEKIRKDGGLKRLKGLLYFTDGDGVYPQEKPPYETAFVFTEAKALKYNIPEWIVKLCLDLPSYNGLWS